MRILHVISGLDPANGGPSFALEGFARALVREGLDISVAATWQNPSGFPLAERLRSGGVAVTLIGPARGKLSRHPQLPSIIRGAVADADIVHIHALWEDIQHFAARQAQRQRVPYVITPHGMLAPWSLSQGRWFNRLGKRLYLAARLRRNLNRATALHFTTSVERDLVARLKLRPRSIVEPVGVDLSDFQTLPAAGAFRARHPQLSNRTLVLFLSRLSPQKGLDRLIPAFARSLRESPSDAMLVLAGPDYDGYSRTVHELVERHSLGDRVLFTGMLHGVERIEAMVDCDFFVLPSRHENFGIVVAEALAAGAPVLLSPEVNIGADIAGAGAGEIVSGDVEPLSAALARWIADADLRRGYAGNARAVAARYDWQQIAHHWVDHYARLSHGQDKGL
jgi:glycosyltransferase involved in cell wall biosynthesis